MMLATTNASASADTDDLERRTRQYARTRDPRLRQELAARHEGLVRKLAARFAGGSEPLEDLLQVGSVGLVHALDRFDPGQGARFSTFATPTILGEFRRHFRDKADIIQVPRPLRERRDPAERAAGRIAAETGRPATAQQVARRLGEAEERVLEALACSGALAPLSLDHAAAGDGAADDGLPLLDRLGRRDPALEAFERHADLRRALGGLEARERAVLALRYACGLSQKEAAGRMGISQMHVSRLERRALGLLRQALSG